ncbi:unnamed protein product [Dracunculus medinensis]|uniref:HDAg domain-containing protein n=1 Tax=Dracunculus medinensis TaxID=318479 RepID=A0A0N4UDV9_DRAME|nr:unnamed protein product [Dracunculus medinensis]
MLKPSAQLRDLDLVQWLNNKLGDNNELWCGQQAASLISREMLVELETCFQSLETHVKLKIVLALPHLSHRLMTMWRDPLMNLLNLARRDADDWIETVSYLYRDFPSHKCITPLVEPTSYFCRTLEELRKTIKKHKEAKNLKLLPPAMHYVSEAAIKARFGIENVDATKYFNLRKPAKSHSLKTDLIRSAESGVNSTKIQKTTVVAPSFPIRMRSTVRKPNNDLPMRGIPSVNTCKMSAGFTNEPRKRPRQLVKREGGAKLIDIDEIPQALKIRRREQAAEEKAKKLQEKEEKKRLQAEKADAEKEARRTAASVKTEPSNLRSKSPVLKEDMPSTSVSTTATTTTTPSNSNTAQSFDASVPTELPSYANVRERPTMDLEPASFALLTRLDQRETIARRQCEEMLSTANVLDVQGHRMVTAFMSGNKVHPFPHMGDVVTLKLSETYEDELREDGRNQRYRVETYFQVSSEILQMDYRTGEWKRLRKTRALRPEEVESLNLMQYTFTPNGNSRSS